MASETPGLPKPRFPLLLLLVVGMRLSAPAFSRDIQTKKGRGFQQPSRTPTQTVVSASPPAGELTQSVSLQAGSPEPSDSVTLLYVTETVAVDSLPNQAETAAPDVYVAAFNESMRGPESPSMYVTVFYGNGTEGDTLVAHLQQQLSVGVWKRPFQLQRSTLPSLSDEHVTPSKEDSDAYRIRMAQATDDRLTAEYTQARGSGFADPSKSAHRTKLAKARTRKLRRHHPKPGRAYIQFQPAYGRDLHTFVHLAAGRANVHQASTLLDDAVPKGVIFVKNVLEIPHAYRKWMDPLYAPLWDPEFTVTGDYWSSVLAPWVGAFQPGPPLRIRRHIRVFLLARPGCPMRVCFCLNFLRAVQCHSDPHEWRDLRHG